MYSFQKQSVVRRLHVFALLNLALACCLATSPLVVAQEQIISSVPLQPASPIPAASPPASEGVYFSPGAPGTGPTVPLFVENVQMVTEQDGEVVPPVIEKRMTPELLLKLGRLGGSSVSPDGTQVAYTVKKYDLAENKGHSTLHVINRTDKKDSIAIKDWSSIGSLDWIETAAGNRLFFEGTPKKADDTDDDEDGPTNQAYSLDVAAGAVTQLTDVEDGIANLKVANGGTKIAFTVDIKLDDKASEIYKDLPETEGRIIDSLMFRHWNAWHDYKYSHLHIASINADGTAGTATDLMPGLRVDCPVPPFGGAEQFAWSPDGSEIAFTMKKVEDWAQSTNSDVYLVDLNSLSVAETEG